ncbi:tetratricopeptide repeat protein [Myceligenerans pegani]|uniref:Tetratricopeptide repeat protein n=1 Tax=Myceligenerans pegani TaxID=2776917 RepID=A0ABR9MVU6_9MICO|nr:tetratricopeptide repeat protein [Myceligenerans sp. TRM 65318]MBE1875505.1 tetratricopeptide repeat protein [Myceligenerans sp. TRM 65318]MBE3017776.1 tetratricopeptide repeat protein [Myceligenerans sp. TRM 65318]
MDAEGYAGREASRGIVRRMWVYGLAASAAIVVGVIATILPASIPEWVRQIILTAGIVGSILGAILVERWFTLDDRRRAMAARDQEALHESVNLAVRPPGDADAPGRLLSPVRDGDTQVVTFLGREREIQDLVDWCTEGGVRGRRSLRVRLVTGPGGVGKTRLAQELQSVMRHRGWECRNLRTGVETEAMAVLRRGHGDAPVLFVVDYAENWHDGLATLLERANDDSGTVRILLLARQSGQWWTDLCQLPGVGAVVGAADPLELSPRIVPSSGAGSLHMEQQEIVRAAARDFAEHLGVGAPSVLLPDAVPDARMLDLLSIALVEVLRQEDGSSSGSDTAGQSIHAVFDELLRHEARDWKRSAQLAGVRTDSHTLRTLVAAGCLLGAADQQEAEELARRVAGLCTHGQAPDPIAAARWLREQYPPPESGDPADEHHGDRELVGTPGWLGSLHPDRLAEHLVVSALTASDVAEDARELASLERRTALLHNLNARQAEQAMIVLTRATADPSRSGATAPRARTPRGLDPRWSDDIAEVALELVDRLPEKRPVISAVHEVIPWPDPPSALHAVGHRLAGRLDASISRGSRMAGSEYAAQAKHVLGNWEHTRGRYREALAARERATRTYRVLALRNPGRFGPDLALSLDNLGDSYASLGRYGDALKVRREAVRRWENHAVTSDQLYASQLARSLHNLGISYRDLGRPDMALTTHREALRIRRALAEQGDRHTDTAALARSLSSIGRCLSDLGDLDAAHEVFVEARGIWRRLDARTPTRYEDYLAHALGDLATCSESLAKRDNLPEPDDALRTHEEARGLWQRLAARSPVLHRSGLARCLTNLGTAYANVERFDDSRDVHAEAIEIYRELVDGLPARFEPNLAWSLGSSAISLMESGRDAVASDVFEESLAIFRRRYGEGMRSVQFLDGYRTTLARAAVLLERAGRDADAMSRRNEMVSIDVGVADEWLRG